jgi:polyhydroxyalkanoate synthesis regulator phasin
MKQKLGAPSDSDVDALKQENDELKRQVGDMERKIEDIQN